MMRHSHFCGISVTSIRLPLVFMLIKRYSLAVPGCMYRSAQLDPLSILKLALYIIFVELATHDDYHF